MATYQRFEQLPVWQTAAELYDRADDFLDRAPPRLRGSFRDQLERAALSVSNNIAEGFERGTTKELLAFIYIARGSAGEVRSMVTVASRRPYLHGHAADLSTISSLAESCSRQLRAWADFLQNCDIAGPRHLTDETRARFEGRKADQANLAAFDQLLAQHLPADHPLHPSRRPRT